MTHTVILSETNEFYVIIDTILVRMSALPAMAASSETQRVQRSELRMFERGNVFEASDSDDESAPAPKPVLRQSLSCFTFGTDQCQCPSEGESLSQKVWRGSLLAAVYITGRLNEMSAPNPTRLNVCAGLDVLEIGCGCGLAGMAAGRSNTAAHAQVSGSNFVFEASDLRLRASVQGSLHGR